MQPHFLAEVFQISCPVHLVCCRRVLLRSRWSIPVVWGKGTRLQHYLVVPFRSLVRYSMHPLEKPVFSNERFEPDYLVLQGSMEGIPWT